MKSHITKGFRKYLAALPQDVQVQARKSYESWRETPYHNSLHFKEVNQRQAVYSVRVGIGHRALGRKVNDELYWFWIGTHAEYDKLLKRL